MRARHPLLLLAGHDPSSPSGRAGVLSTDLDAPVVTDTPVVADPLQSLEILTELAVELVREDLGVLAVDDVLLPVEEPGGDLELGRVLEDGDDSLELVRVELTGSVFDKASVQG